jgi:hypothetical protein
MRSDVEIKIRNWYEHGIEHRFQFLAFQLTTGPVPRAPGAEMQSPTTAQGTRAVPAPPCPSPTGNRIISTNVFSGRFIALRPSWRNKNGHRSPGRWP